MNQQQPTSIVIEPDVLQKVQRLFDQVKVPYSIEGTDELQKPYASIDELVNDLLDDAVEVWEGALLLEEFVEENL